MVYGSVCSGIEAATLAWHWLGWRASFFSEIEKFPRALLAHRWPLVPTHGDFTTIEKDQYEKIDLLVGGTPCQSFSVAGLRRGMADERGNLALEFIRLVQRLRPKWVVWENVPGVLSSNGGRDFGSFVGALAELGYGWAYRVLDAQNFGVPQRRRRVFVVGYFGDWRPPAAVLFEPESLRGDTPAARKAKKKTAGTTGKSVETHRQLAFGQNNTSGPVNVSHAINAHGGPHNRLDFESETFILHGSQDPVVSDKAHPVGRNQGLENVLAVHENQRAELTLNTTVGALSSGGGKPGQGYPCVSVSLRGRESGATAETSGTVSPALRAADGGGSKQHVLTNVVRRLTPVECERLQGMPDNYTRIPWRNKYYCAECDLTYTDKHAGGLADCLSPAECPKCGDEQSQQYSTPDGPRYTAIGNSMAVPVMRWIGERIQMFEDS